jgi:hypothetical protein
MAGLNPSANSSSDLETPSPDKSGWGWFDHGTDERSPASRLHGKPKKPKSARRLFPQTGQTKESEVVENDQEKPRNSMCNAVNCTIQGGKKRRKSRKRRKSVFKKKRTKRRRRRKTKRKKRRKTHKRRSYKKR